MKENRSPWIHQLDKDRQPVSLDRDEKCDVAIIGAGIAGVSTAFFTLKHTDKKVILLDGGMLAHGATGHNAGQVTGYFERPFSSIVEEFGLETACRGQENLYSAWDLLDEMYGEAGLSIPFFRFEGLTGYSTKEQVFGHLKNELLRRKGGLRTGSKPEILEDSEILAEMPDEYQGLFSLISRKDLALKLQTFDPQYIAISSLQKGVVNSALFCQEMAKYLLENYADRFSLYENTFISKVVLKDGGVLLDAMKHTVECENVVLCTNGFENFDIIAPSGLSIDRRFHGNVRSLVAFMAGYLEPQAGLPSATSYFQKAGENLSDDDGEGYFYVTHRPYEYDRDLKRGLVSVGGPDFTLEDRAKYDRRMQFSDKAGWQISEFVRRTYDKAEDLDFIFMWHGLMGYTQNRLRMIGPDPEHPRLLYNLGCNGVGILPSIFGGNKVGRALAGETFPPSIFDVPAKLKE